jgi:cell division protease FtsH
MITQFGMSEGLGLVALEGPRTPMFLPVPASGPKEYSEETARLVDEEVKKLLSEAHAKVRNCLASHKQALEELAKLLLEKEVVERPQLQAILKGADGSCGDRVEDFGHEDQARVSDDHKR